MSAEFDLSKVTTAELRAELEMRTAAADFHRELTTNLYTFLADDGTHEELMSLDAWHAALLVAGDAAHKAMVDGRESPFDDEPEDDEDDEDEEPIRRPKRKRR